MFNGSIPSATVGAVNPKPVRLSILELIRIQYIQQFKF